MSPTAEGRARLDERHEFAHVLPFPAAALPIDEPYAIEEAFKPDGAGFAPSARPRQGRPPPDIEQLLRPQPGEVDRMVFMALVDGKTVGRRPARSGSSHEIRLRIFPESFGKLASSDVGEAVLRKKANDHAAWFRHSGSRSAGPCCICWSRVLSRHSCSSRSTRSSLKS